MGASWWRPVAAISIAYLVLAYPVAELAQPRVARRVVEAEGTWAPLDFSPDGTQLLVSRFRAIDDADLFLVDLRSGARRMLTPDPATSGKGSVVGAAFGENGRSV